MNIGMRKGAIPWVRALLLCSLLVVAGRPALAQLGRSTMSGLVTDATGAVVTGASVTVVHADTGFRRTTVTNETGQYNLPGLTPGPYDVVVELTGFRRAQRQGLVLQVDQNMRVDVALQVGEVTETVEITAEAPLIESQSATLGAVIDTQKITSLPLNGRNFLQLAVLVPGVTTGTEGGDQGADGFSANGLRADQNAFQIDGTSNSDPLRNRITVRPSIDSLQEFKIQTNNYSAEFGKGAGAQVNIVTKSGTKEFHGALWEFLRNDNVQARNFFDRNRRSFPCDPSDTDVANRKACAPQYNQNQFGANLGGPLGERTFFFGAFEGFRQRRGGATVTQVPTAAQRSGDFSRTLLSTTAGTDALGRTWQRGQLFDAKTSRQVSGRYVREPYVNNQIPLNHFDPVALKMVANTEFMPLANSAGTFNANGDNIDNFLDGRSAKIDSEDFSGRIDHQFSDNDTIFGRYSFQDSRGYSPGTFVGFGTEDNYRTMNTTIGYTKVFSPTTVGEFRFGHQGSFQDSGSEDGLAGKDWLGVFEVPGMDFVRQSGVLGSPSIDIAGATVFGNGGGPFFRDIHSYQPMAIVSVTKGKHFLKFGGELRFVKLDSIGPLGNDGGTRGGFTYNTVGWTGVEGVANTGHATATFLLGLAGQKTRLVGDFRLNYTAREWGAFIQDDYKVSTNLTLNLGLRYLYYTPPFDSRNAISSWTQDQECTSYALCGPTLLFDQNSPYQPYYALAGVDLPRSLAPTDKKNIGPRFGFAWQPSGGGTVFRGGYGIFYDTPPISLNADTLLNYPQVIEDQENVSLGQHGPPVPNALIGFRISQPGLGTGGPGSVAQFQPGPNNFNPNFKNAYIQSWNFSIQRQLPGQMMIEAAYAGSKGTRLHRQIVLNLAEPLGPSAVIPNLLNDPSIPAGIGDSKNQLRRLIPITYEEGVIIALQNVFEEQSTAFSNYHAGTIRFEKRAGQGMSFLTSYTFSKAISDNPGWRGGGQGLSAAGAQNILDRTAEKGLADLDHRHRFTTAVVYELPFGRGGSGFVNKLFGGWATDAIFAWQTGLPMTAQHSGDIGSMGTNQALRPDLVCNPNLPGSDQTVDRFFDTSCLVVQTPMRYGTAGRAIITGPGTMGLDLGIRKNTFITERVNLQFRAEFFNLTNHTNFLPPNKLLGNTNFGRVLATRDPRIIQFGMKLLF